MPRQEQVALQLAKGRILDVGAGSGCHSLALKELGKDSLAIDISPLSVKAMQERGVKALHVNVFDEHFTGQFDTILMLMNGSGIIGKLKNMPDFCLRMKQLLAPGGCILLDSSDLRTCTKMKTAAMCSIWLLIIMEKLTSGCSTSR